jgi:hypothetical protein
MIRRTGINRAWKLIVIGWLVGLGALAGRAGAQPEPPTPEPPSWCSANNPEICIGQGGGWPPSATPGPGPIPGPGPGPHPQPTPPPCPNIVEIILSGPHRDESRGVCYVVIQRIDLCSIDTTGTITTREVECPKPTTSNPCVDSNGNPLFSIGTGGIFCGRDGGSWRVEARVRFPPYVIDVRPYPATRVGWPTAIRLSELGRAAGEGTLDYVPLGGGKPEDPKPGDRRKPQSKQRGIETTDRSAPETPSAFLSQTGRPETDYTPTGCRGFELSSRKT